MLELPCIGAAGDARKDEIDRPVVPSKVPTTASETLSDKAKATVSANAKPELQNPRAGLFWATAGTLSIFKTSDSAVVLYIEFSYFIVVGTIWWFYVFRTLLDSCETLKKTGVLKVLLRGAFKRVYVLLVLRDSCKTWKTTGTII